MIGKARPSLEWEDIMKSAGEMKVFCDPTITSCVEPDGSEANASYAFVAQEEFSAEPDDDFVVAARSCVTSLREEFGLNGGIFRDFLAGNCILGHSVITSVSEIVAGWPSIDVADEHQVDLILQAWWAPGR